MLHDVTDVTICHICRSPTIADRLVFKGHPVCTSLSTFEASTVRCLSMFVDCGNLLELVASCSILLLKITRNYDQCIPMLWNGAMKWCEFKRVDQTETSSCKPPASCGLLRCRKRSPWATFSSPSSFPWSHRSNPLHGCLGTGPQTKRWKAHHPLDHCKAFSDGFSWFFHCLCMIRSEPSSFRGHSGCVMNSMVKSLMSKHHTGLALGFGSLLNWNTAGDSSSACMRQKVQADTYPCKKLA